MTPFPAAGHASGLNFSGGQGFRVFSGTMTLDCVSFMGAEWCGLLSPT